MTVSSTVATPPLLDVEALRVGIHTDRGIVAAVDALDLCIARGETLALVGESGCGKSLTALTLMRLLPRAAVVLQGTARFGDADLLVLPEHAMRRVRGRRIGMIFQDPSTALNPVLRVGTQIVEAIEAHTDLRGAAARARAIDWLRRVGIPDPSVRVDDHPHRFSGGQQQRVLIAIALAGEPALLIADEATSALDTTVQAQILDLLRDLRRERRLALLLVTHDLGLVSTMADRVALMYAGQIVEVASARDFLTAPRHPYAQALLRSIPDAETVQPALAGIGGQVPVPGKWAAGCRFAPRCDSALGTCTTVPPPMSTFAGAQVRCVLYDVGTEPSAPANRAAATSGVAQAPVMLAAGVEGRRSPLLEVHDLRVAYRRTGSVWRRPGHVDPLQVDRVSFALHAGDTLALIGESGCGKTTVGKAILQLLRRDAQVDGRVIFNGIDLMELRGSALRRVRRDLQIVFQDPAASLDPRLDVAETLDEAMRALRPEWDAPERRRRMARMMAQVGLATDVLDRHPHALSGGQRQRIAIARALCVEPRLIVCDEPTSALDMSVQAQVLGLLRRLQRDLGLTCLVITHDLAVVRQLATEVAVMQAGKIAVHGSVDGVFSAPRSALVERLWQAVPRRRSMFDGPSSGVLSDI